MFNISEIVPLNDGRYRLEVVTDDASLFGLVCIFESLAEFSSLFRHKMNVSRKVNELELARPERSEKGRVERQAILSAYEHLEGSRKEKLHFLHDQLKKQGLDFITLDGVISMLALAKRENQSGVKNGIQKSA